MVPPLKRELRERCSGLSATAKNSNCTPAVKTDPGASPSPVAAPAAVTAEAVWSSGVPFFPPSKKYWRIGNKWYDFAEFLSLHPGGAQALLLSRDRFEDATFVFESHHHNYPKARAVIRKYEVPVSKVIAAGLRVRPLRESKEQSAWNHHDIVLDSRKHPNLLGHDAFYSVLRRRVTAHLRAVGCKDGSATWTCVALFWIVFAVWAAGMFATWRSGSVLIAAGTGLAASWLGAFGHNWVHQPRYKNWGWALLSLDTLGFSSEGWYREHNLQHHMYTNTPWDNHFRGTDPFLVTDPTVKRGFMQGHIMPFINPVLLCFGVYANYVAHTIQLLLRREELSVGKTFLPLHAYLMMSRWGLLHGFLLMFGTHAVIGVYYFTMALMNHNAEHTMDVKGRNAAKDWGHAQLHSSADWGVELSFLQAGIYLWLNYHTVHHLFPRVDFSHHPAIQQILIKTCEEFDITYTTGSPFSIYKQMLKSFATPQSLMQEIVVYSGGV